MTFDPYGNVTYDKLYDELYENNVVDIYRLESLRDKILQCSYYDIDLGMYVVVSNNTDNPTTYNPTTHTRVPINTNINVESCYNNTGIRAWRMRTNISTVIVGDTVINYYLLPIISTKYPIDYHSHNLYKDHGEIYLSFEKPLPMIDENSAPEYYHSIKYRYIIFSDVLTKDIEITTPLSDINTLNKLIEYVLKLSCEPCHTINNRFGTKTYTENNGRYYNTYHWIRVTK